MSELTYKTEKHTPIDGDYYFIRDSTEEIIAKTWSEKEAKLLVDSLNFYHIADTSEMVKLNAEMLEMLKDIKSYIEHSEGLAGYHRNGDVALWGELEGFNGLNDLIAQAEKGQVNHD